MKNSPISVIVCTLNEEKYIKNCLTRLKAQKIVPEIIVVDGHSKDNTIKIAKKYADKIVYDNKDGISDARNVGWKKASAKIVAFCDCDSRPDPDWTEKIIKNMKDNIAISGPLISYDGTKSMKKKFRVWTDFFPRFAKKIGYNCIWGANMAFKKSSLKKYPFELKFLEDFYMSKRLRKTKKVSFVKSLKLPVSSRRFTSGFHRACFKYYVIGGLKIVLGIKTKGYY